MDSIVTTAQDFEQQSISVQEGAPWFLADGKATPDNYLKTLTPFWSTQTWEKYLNWFENISGQRAESLVSSKKYDEICDTEPDSIFVYSQSSADDELRVLVVKYLEKLTEHQRRVIEMCFWEGRSERYIAEKLGIRRQPVNRLKKRAFNKIKKLVREGVSSRIKRGKNSSLMKGVKNERNLLLAQISLEKAS